MFFDVCFVVIFGVFVFVIMIVEDGFSFVENLLFIYCGLFGFVVLQVFSYWCEGEVIMIDLLFGVGLIEYLCVVWQDVFCKSLIIIFVFYLFVWFVDYLVIELDLVGNIGEWFDVCFD